MDYQPKAHRAQQLIRQGNHREAIPLLRELLDYTFVVDFEYDDWLRWLADAYKKQGNHIPAGYIYLYLHYFDNAHDCFELGRSSLDLALCHEVRRFHKQAAELYRAESHFVRAAINLELTGDMKDAVSAWETTRSNIHQSEDPYPYALATVNLALALNTIGYRAGLLDIDVYGPSLPTLLGVKGRPAVKDRRIIPLEAEGLKIMSLGFLMDDDTPVIWRGPIVSGIIRQFLQDVDWSGLDYLIIDLPPGTGDAQLSLAQSVPLDGAIVVTTPSDLALVDAARGLQMFKTLKVDVLGIVENMSHYIWPGIEGVRQTLDLLRSKGGPQEAIDQLEQTLKEHGRVYVFGQGGGRREARRLGTDFLGEIPLNGKVREGGDQGQPIVTNDPTGPVTAAFVQLAKTLAELQPVASAEGEDKPKKKKRGLFSFLKG
ncbi:MAG: Mrp/NBP35 family ATP-binding protein [Myxococcota bacterium]